MTNYSTNDNKTSSSVDGLSKNEEPPNYTVANPLLNDRNNITSNTVQPQPQWNTTSNTYSVLKVNNPDLNNITSYKCWSVLNILCCFWILGCIACYFSCETDRFKTKGDFQGALRASRNARKMNCIATILGIIIFLINLIYYFTKV